MELYLIRHTTPDIQKGMCYGQADIGTTASFTEEAQCIKEHLPQGIATVYSSPLQRCRQLAEFLFPQHSIQFDNRLKEIHCGDWELQWWDSIERAQLQHWLDDSLNVCMPGGESYIQLYNRVVHFFDTMPQHRRLAIVSHGGVIRSLLSYINHIALQDSFHHFSIRYGCVVKVTMEENGFRHAILHNPQSEKEQHRPSFA